MGGTLRKHDVMHPRRVIESAMMKFSTPLIQGTLLRRYKRVLADVALPTGAIT